MRHEPIMSNDALCLATAVYVEVYKEKYDMGKVFLKVIEDVKYDRHLASAGLINKFFRGFCLKYEVRRDTTSPQLRLLMLLHSPNSQKSYKK